MLLRMEKELTRSENECERFEGSGVLVTQAKVRSNAWFSCSAPQTQSTTLLSRFYTLPRPPGD